MKKIMASAVTVASVLLVATVYSRGATVGGPWVKSIEATSVLEQGKDTYGDSNIMDLTDDSWCEGNKDAGIGVSISIRLDAPTAVKMLYIKNGMGISKYWAANNRIKELKINGIMYSLRDAPEFQKIALSGAKADELKLEIVSVYSGSKYNDTCLAEVAFSDPGRNFNMRDNYSKIAGKPWQYPVGDGGDVITFTRGLLVSSEVLPCGDETCPQEHVGSCKLLGRDRYECRFVEYCRGTYDPKLNRAGRICSQSPQIFMLDTSGGVPVITMEGKKTKLEPYN